MNVVYTPAVRQWENDLPLLQRATQQLEEVVGRSTGLVTATWDRVEDERGRALYALRLKDFTGEVDGRFAPDELQPGTHLMIRLRQLWGDLLEIRNHKLLQDLQQSGD